MRKFTLFLSLLVSLCAAAQVSIKVSTETEKHYYKFLNASNPLARITTNGAGFKGTLEEASTLFTFEAVEGEEDVYYIKSATYDAYVSALDVEKGQVLKWTENKTDTEKWKLKVNGSTVTFLSYATKDEATDALRLGWNPIGTAENGNIGLWETSPTNNVPSYWTLVEKNPPAAPTFTPVALSDLTDGWYQLKVVSGYTTSVDKAKGRYVTNTPASYGGNTWIFSLRAQNVVSSTFFYIEKNPETNKYAIKTCKGKYAGATGFISDTPVWPFEFTTDAGDNTHIYIKGQNGTSSTYNKQYMGWYDANTLFVGVSSSHHAGKTFQFSKVDDYIAEHYDVYSIQYNDFEPIKGAVGVTYHADDYNGVRLAYPGGAYFMRKDAQPVVASNFDITSSRNVNFLFLDVDTENKVVNICQNLTSTVEEIIRVSENPNQVGFPDEDMTPYNEPLKKALKDAMDGKNITNLTALQTAFTNWKSNLAASSAAIVMPKDGKAYRLVNVQQNLKNTRLLANDESGNMVVKPYYDAESKNLHSTFVCHKVSDDKYIFTNAAKGNYMVWKGLGQGYNGDRGYSESYVANKCQFDVISQPSGRPGTFRLVSERNSNGSVGSLVLDAAAGNLNGWGDNVCFDANYSNAFLFEEVDDYAMNAAALKAPAEADDYEYATLYLPYATTIPEGVSAYTATREDAALRLWAVEGGTLPKNTAVILRKAADADAEPALFVPAIEPGAAAEGNVLSGTVVAGTATPADAYVLSGKFGPIGFYKYTAASLPLAKAYLVAADVPAGSEGVQGLRFTMGDATGIGAVATDKMPADCYDLSGRRVATPAKGGIYVKNGKKIFVK